MDQLKFQNIDCPVMKKFKTLGYQTNVDKYIEKIMHSWKKLPVLVNFKSEQNKQLQKRLPMNLIYLSPTQKSELNRVHLINQLISLMWALNTRKECFLIASGVVRFFK